MQQVPAPGQRIADEEAGPFEDRILVTNPRVRQRLTGSSKEAGGARPSRMTEGARRGAYPLLVAAGMQRPTLRFLVSCILAVASTGVGCGGGDQGDIGGRGSSASANEKTASESDVGNVTGYEAGALPPQPTGGGQIDPGHGQAVRGGGTCIGCGFW